MLTATIPDNNLYMIDILGSWLEVGMVMAAIIVGGILMIPALKNFLKNRKISYPCSSKFRSIHSRVHEYLTELRVKLNADRAIILQFHNGGEFLDGSSVKRFSLTHESCAVGISESMDSRHELLASTFVDMLDMLSEGKIALEATSNLPDCHFKRHLESNHTLVFLLVPVKDIRGVLIMGCLLVEWCSWDKADLIDDEKIAMEVPEYTRYIEGQLYTGGKNNGK